MHLCVYSNIHMLLYVQCICTMDAHTWEAVNVHFAGFYTVIWYVLSVLSVCALQAHRNVPNLKVAELFFTMMVNNLLSKEDSIELISALSLSLSLLFSLVLSWFNVPLLVLNVCLWTFHTHKKKKGPGGPGMVSRILVCFGGSFWSTFFKEKNVFLSMCVCVVFVCVCLRVLASKHLQGPRENSWIQLLLPNSHYHGHLQKSTRLPSTTHEYHYRFYCAHLCFAAQVRKKNTVFNCIHLH